MQQLNRRGFLRRLTTLTGAIAGATAASRVPQTHTAGVMDTAALTNAQPVAQRGTVTRHGATTASVAYALQALITDLRQHGLIGT